MHGYELIYEGEDSPKGKVWRITPLSDGSGLCIEYGARDARLRSVTVPKSRCREGCVYTEMDFRVATKTAEGYVIVNNHVEVKESDGDAKVTPEPESPVLAYLSYRPAPEHAKEHKIRQIGAHIVESAREALASGTYQAARKGQRYVVSGHFMGQQAREKFSIRLTVGQMIHENEPTLGLLLASVVSRFPDLADLADADGNPMSPRALAEAINPDPEVLERFGIVRAMKLGEAQPLGEWFF